jgi:hypothetical protein
MAVEHGTASKWWEELGTACTQPLLRLDLLSLDKYNDKFNIYTLSQKIAEERIIPLLTLYSNLDIKINLISFNRLVNVIRRTAQELSLYYY